MHLWKMAPIAGGRTHATNIYRNVTMQTMTYSNGAVNRAYCKFAAVSHRDENAHWKEESARE